MRVSLTGMLGNAIISLKVLKEELGAYMGSRALDSFSVTHGINDSIFMLEELQKHARETAAGEHTIEEFAEFYCLKEKGGE